MTPTVPSLYVRVPEYERMSVLTDGSYCKVTNISSSRFMVCENGSITETTVVTGGRSNSSNVTYIEELADRESFDPWRFS